MSGRAAAPRGGITRRSRRWEALFGPGLLKGRVAALALLRGGVHVLFGGGGSAAIGYLIGVLVPELF